MEVNIDVRVAKAKRTYLRDLSLAALCACWRPRKERSGVASGAVIG